MDALNRLKAEANRMFTEGNRIFPDDDCFPHFKKACVKYQEVVSAMIKFECDGIEESGDGFMSDLKSFEDYAYFKASIFSNYALANFKLNNFDGCNRLSNVCIFLCINPKNFVRDIDMVALVDLYVSSMAPSPSIEGAEVTGMIPDPNCLQEKLRKLAGKATFRRGQVYLERDNFRSAIIDFEAALALFPTDKEILSCTDEAKKRLETERLEGKSQPVNASDEGGGGASTSSSSSQPGKNKLLFVREFAKYSRLISNGGTCLNGSSLWSQTKETSKVYIPIEIITNAERGHIQSSKMKVIFKKMNIEVLHDDVMIFEAKLEYFIEKMKCKWSLKPAAKLLEKVGTATATDGVAETEDNDSENRKLAICDISVLTLQLCKVPSFEYFPGCEWWDRVFPSDSPVLVPLEAAEAQLASAQQRVDSLIGGGGTGGVISESGSVKNESAPSVFTNEAVFDSGMLQVPVPEETFKRSDNFWNLPKDDPKGP